MLVRGRDLAQARRLETGLIGLRWFVVMLGGLLTFLNVQARTDAPGYAVPVGFLLVAALAIGNVAITLFVERAKRPDQLSAIGLGAFVLDITVITGLVWIGSDSPTMLTSYCLFEIPSNLILERVGRAPVDCADPDRLGAGVDGHDVRHRRVVVHGGARPARDRRGRLLSGHGALPDLLDPGQRARADRRAVHDGRAGRGHRRRSGVGSAAQARRPARARRAGSGCSWSKGCRPSCSACWRSTC